MNVGGGGSTVIYMGGNRSPEGSAAAGALVILGLGIYGVVAAIDHPKAERLADSIVATSMENCRNVSNDPSLYENELHDMLMKHWSWNLRDIDEKEAFVICVDPNLNTFTLPYRFADAAGEHFGEYRVAGLMYTDRNGAQTMVVKPPTDIIPKTSSDPEPDKPTSLHAVFEIFQAMPAETLQTYVGNGVDVSVLLQQDGAIIGTGSTEPKNEDDNFLADADLTAQVITHYEFSDPSF